MYSPNPGYKERILIALSKFESAVSVDRVRKEAKMKNWESTKALLLELAIEGKLTAQHTFHGWIFQKIPAWTL